MAATPDVGLFKSESGQLIHMDLPLPEHMADKVTKGQLVRVDEDGQPYSGDAAGPELGAAPSKPSVNAPKAAWVGWAVSCGASIDDAEAMTKQDLVEQYGG